MITEDGLKSGDKIPSERKLSERLNVGRSSVREALRALELLGLIETKQGEGTYIRDFRENHLVKLVSTFVLQDEKAKQDVSDTKYFIEMDCLRLLLRNQEVDFQDLKLELEDGKLNDDDFFYLIIKKTENHLLLKIWLILKDYYQSISYEKKKFTKIDFYNLLNAMEANNEEETLSAYRKLRKMSDSPIIVTDNF
ncbi:GntR family transcriptional regulator [Neobacillus sp. PS3-40]|uniref:FadR/GntR family transcriptional regulator n=1 Tax=Neobacillus sp. PS3-40 TaxID=3070679 RepID=UPI0027E1003F|nr:GntR family transcriptional regulator [Neobacillus sp. PS3-40]WML45640.1 GntR family transcriptional regulator [Neobacillus sp. PS3-40]